MCVCGGQEEDKEENEIKGRGEEIWKEEVQCTVPLKLLNSLEDFSVKFQFFFYQWRNKRVSGFVKSSMDFW